MAFSASASSTRRGATDSRRGSTARTASPPPQPQTTVVEASASAAPRHQPAPKHQLRPQRIDCAVGRRSRSCVAEQIDEDAAGTRPRAPHAPPATRRRPCPPHRRPRRHRRSCPCARPARAVPARTTDRRVPTSQASAAASSAGRRRGRRATPAREVAPGAGEEAGLGASRVKVSSATTHCVPIGWPRSASRPGRHVDGEHARAARGEGGDGVDRRRDRALGGARRADAEQRVDDQLAAPVVAGARRVEGLRSRRRRPRRGRAPAPRRPARSRGAEHHDR